MAAAYLERMGTRIRARREELGLSRGELARSMPGKVNENQIYRWEKGLHRPQDGALEALAVALKVPDASYFLAPSPEDGAGDLLGTMGGTGREQLEVVLTKRVERMEELIAHQNENLARQSEILEELREAVRQLAAGQEQFDSSVAALAESMAALAEELVAVRRDLPKRRRAA